MPPKNKAKNAPNQHDKRHESGLAPPGKRVTKKASNGQLNGSPNGQTVPAPALPNTGLNQGFKFPRPADTPAPAAQPVAREHAGPLEGAERDRVYSDASLEEGGQCDEMGESTHDAAPGTADLGARPPTSKVAASGHANGKLASISTILSYYPLRDAISILILLLSLPPTLVLVIQTLFASLTFVPPTAGISLSTLPNIKEMFNSSNFGAPALATILIVDLLFWLVWVVVPKPIQNVFLDLSQAVIAVSLSGATASTGGPTYSIATSTIIVCVVHVLRYRAIHLTALDYLRSVIHKMDIGMQFDAPSFATNFVSSPSLERGSIQSACRIIIGIHIVSQGVTTCIRRSLVKANEQSANLPAITKTDPEATAGSDLSSRISTTAAEPAQHILPAVGTDGSHTPLDSKARDPNGKKKRKQANQVRSQQPLWAAVASTKVTFVKEMEQRDSVDDSREAAKMDTNSASTSVSLQNHTTDRVWITEVRDTQIHFSVELSPSAAVESVEKMEEGKSIGAGIDKTKPFFVRINGAAWSSTRILPCAAASEPAGPKSGLFNGEIFGLTPLSSYSCEVLSIANQSVLCSARVITQPAPTAEQTVASSQLPHQALRPTSPITTLRQSVQAAEIHLSDARNRQKKGRKDQRAANSELKREIASLKGKLESSSGADDKHERRVAQIKQHKKQAEEATAEVKAQIEALGNLPSHDVAASDSTKHEWEAAVKSKNAANKDLENAKAEADREIGGLKSEISQATSRYEKASARLIAKTEELEKAKIKQKADMSAREKREAERADMLKDRQENDNALAFQCASMQSEIDVYTQKTQEIYNEIWPMQNWQTQPPPYPGYPQPSTPDFMQNGANGFLPLTSPPSNGFPAFSAQHFSSAFHSPQHSLSQQQQPPPTTRGRSSSMLSQISNFTDAAEEYHYPHAQHQQPQPFAWPIQPPTLPGATPWDDRKESEASGGSGSGNGGSTGSNSPRPDAKPFVPGSKAAPLSPIGPPSSKGKEKATQSPLQQHASAGLGG